MSQNDFTTSQNDFLSGKMILRSSKMVLRSFKMTSPCRKMTLRHGEVILKERKEGLRHSNFTGMCCLSAHWKISCSARAEIKHVSPDSKLNIWNGTAQIYYHEPLHSKTKKKGDI
jgi:hypothetical protein